MGGKARCRKASNLSHGHPNQRRRVGSDETRGRKTEREGGAVTSAQSWSLVGVFHQPGDLLHHGQGAVVNAVTQLNFASVQYHVLVVVCACNNDEEGEEEEEIPKYETMDSSKLCSRPTRVVSGEGFGPLFSSVGQTMSQPDPLPRQQAVGGDCVEEGGVEDVVAGLRHHQTAAQEIEIIQRHEESCGPNNDFYESMTWTAL